MLAALADEDDLTARGISIPDGMDAATLLESASSAVRDAAGCPIIETESTIDLVVEDWCEFDLPAGPTRSVSSVQVNAAEIVGWSNVGETIYLPYGWTSCLPAVVTVTYTHGLTVVPADIVDLVCAMVAMAANDDQYGDGSRIASLKIGTAAVGFVHPAGTESPSPMALPEMTKQSLRARFGSSVAVIGMRR